MYRNSKFGNYILMEQIHKGKFELWRAININNTQNDLVVLKIFDLSDEYQIYASNMELEIYELTKNTPFFNKLVHPVERHNTYLLLPMKSMLGSIEKLFDNKNNRSESLVQEIGIMHLKALHFLHLNGYMYIDIKPTNILYDEKLNFTLTDFDLVSKINGYNGGTGTIGFSSANCLSGNSNCWDDLESLIYTLEFILEYSLPWITKWRQQKIYPNDLNSAIGIAETKIEDLNNQTKHLFIRKYCNYILLNSPNYNKNNNNNPNIIDVIHYENLEKILRE